MEIGSADILSITLKNIYHNLCLSRELICHSGSYWIVELFEMSRLPYFCRIVKIQIIVYGLITK
jgi:hypothetical protein